MGFGEGKKNAVIPLIFREAVLAEHSLKQLFLTHETNNLSLMNSTFIDINTWGCIFVTLYKSE